MANLLFLDIESTGLGPNAAVIEIAAIAYIDGERKHHFQSYIKPHDGCTMDAKAFEINKINPKDLPSFPDPSEVIEKLLDYIDSFECVFSLSGHNVQFDTKKLFGFFCRNAHYGSYLNRFRPGGICTMSIARSVFKGKRNKPDGFSLTSLCDYFKIDIKNAHSALPDIQATIDVYEQLVPMIEVEQQKEVKVTSYQELKRKYMDSKYIQINPEGDLFITKDATSNPMIFRFMLNELYELYGVDGYEKDLH